jgi:hypothetical protein
MNDGGPVLWTPGGRRWANRVLSVLPYASLVGGGILVADVMLTFEEPHFPLLSLAAALIAAAPVGMLVHLFLASGLTSDQRRMWVAGLATRKGPALFAAYFKQSARQSATRALLREHEKPA